VDTLFYFLAFLQIVLGAYLIWQALQWLGYVRRRLHTDPGFYSPRVAVFCPCKGIEPGLEPNLLSLTEFVRQNYEIFIILASESDPARSIVERVAKSFRVRSSAQHRRAGSQEFASESPRGHRGKPEWLQRKGE